MVALPMSKVGFAIYAKFAIPTRIGVWSNCKLKVALPMNRVGFAIFSKFD